MWKEDILLLDEDELNKLLSTYVKEVHIPKMDKIPPDIIYYTCLGMHVISFI